MLQSKPDAIETMNHWGAERIPFLFIIDFEMEAIRLYRTDCDLPTNLAFSFSSIPESQNSDSKGNYTFQKYPVAAKVYGDAFGEVQRQIFAGNSFLVNLTFPTRIETDLTLRGIFERSKAKYKLLVDGEFVVFSPETFVTINEGVISSFPMKGTIDASIAGAEQKILANAKETAEHNTIVDLIRNDLSMVASDVEVKRFRYIDHLVTNQGNILQVSSQITGRLPDNYHTSIGSILFSLLPAGSVTGAPKPKTLEIIRNAEKLKRGYYTGVCGHFDGNNLDSAVMIRFIENRDGQFWFRSGGGVTCNSHCQDEYNELIQKVYVPIV